MPSSKIPTARKLQRRLRIALLGTRGIPANYGGFETFAEELSRRLVKRGHKVTVYGRSHYVDPKLESYRGVDLRVLPCVRHKYLETVSHTALSVLDVLFRGFDAVLVCNAANAAVCWIPRLAGCRVALNVDGIERKRRKWNWAGRGYYRLSEWLAAHLPVQVVTDARAIQDYYLKTYSCSSTFIPYGAQAARAESRKTLQELGLEAGRYLLYVSRLEPENNAHLVLQAYKLSGLDLPLVLVGDAPYSQEYIEGLRRQVRGANVLMPGAIYGEGYRELLSHCLCYFQATEVGGTHPALIEAMGTGALVVAHDTPENREVAQEAALLLSFHEVEALAARMREVAEDPRRYGHLKEAAQRRVRRCYDWEVVTDQYEALLSGAAGEADS
ncbi:MAG TPA: glycosyltransferase [Acidobacteriota bacterium]|nr:glycosyltransferase [Acidobacteriota bacterium]